MRFSCDAISCEQHKDLALASRSLVFHRYQCSRVGYRSRARERSLIANLPRRVRLPVSKHERARCSRWLCIRARLPALISVFCNLTLPLNSFSLFILRGMYCLTNWSRNSVNNHLTLTEKCTLPASKCSLFYTEKKSLVIIAKALVKYGGSNIWRIQPNNLVDITK